MVTYGPFRITFTDLAVYLEGGPDLPEYDPEIDGTPEDYLRRPDVQRALEVAAYRRIDTAVAYADWLASRTSPAQVPLPFPVTPPPRSPRYDPRQGDRMCVVRFTGDTVWFAYCVSRKGDDLVVNFTRPGWDLWSNDLDTSVEDWEAPVPGYMTTWTSADLSVTVTADG